MDDKNKEPLFYDGYGEVEPKKPSPWSTRGDSELIKWLKKDYLWPLPAYMVCMIRVSSNTQNIAGKIAILVFFSVFFYLSCVPVITRTFCNLVEGKRFSSRGFRCTKPVSRQEAGCIATLVKMAILILIYTYAFKF